MRSLFVLFVSCSVFAQQPPPASKPMPDKVTQTRKSTALGLSGLRMVLPKGYTPAADPGSMLFLASTVSKEGFASNLNLTPGPGGLPPRIEVAKARKELVTLYKRMFPSYEFVEDGLMDLFGRKAYWISSRFSQKGTRLRNLQVLVPSRRPCWCTFTVPDDKYEAEIADIRAAIATLKEDAKAPLATAHKYRRDGAAVVIDKLGFRFTPPPGWYPGVAVAGAVLQCYAKAEKGFAANVNVITIPGADAFELATVRKEFEQGLGAVWENVTIERALEARIGGRKAVMFEASFAAPSEKLTVFYHAIPARPRSIVVNYTVRASDAAKLRPVIEASAQTISLGQPK